MKIREAIKKEIKDYPRTVKAQYMCASKFQKVLFWAGLTVWIASTAYEWYDAFKPYKPMVETEENKEIE